MPADDQLIAGAGVDCKILWRTSKSFPSRMGECTITLRELPDDNADYLPRTG